MEQIAGELKPGGKVKYRVQVQDEQGAPAAAAVSVRVWKADAVSDLRAALGDEIGAPLAKKSFADAPQQQNSLPSAQPAADAAARGRPNFPVQRPPLPGPITRIDLQRLKHYARRVLRKRRRTKGPPPPSLLMSDLRWDNRLPGRPAVFPGPRGC